MCDGVKCSALWSNVRLLEVFNRWKRIIEKRMGCKLSVLRKLWPFCPPNLTHHLQLQKKLVGNNRFSALLNFATSWCFCRISPRFFSEFPFFQTKIAHFCEEITAYNRKNVRGNKNSIGRKRNCKGRNLNSKGQNLEYLPFLRISKPFSKSEIQRVPF